MLHSDNKSNSKESCVSWGKSSARGIRSKWGQRSITKNHKQNHYLRNVWNYTFGNCKVSLLVPFMRYLPLKCAWLWHWPLVWAKAKSNYAKQKLLHNFPFDGNSNVCSPIKTYSSYKCAWPWPWPLKWANIKCKYVNEKHMTIYINIYIYIYILCIYIIYIYIYIYTMTIVKFALSLTIYKIFSIKMCMTLTMTFRRGQGQM